MCISLLLVIKAATAVANLKRKKRDDEKKRQTNIAFPFVNNTNFINCHCFKCDSNL